MNINLSNKIVEIAKSYRGQEEIAGNKGFKTKIFEMKMKTMGWLTGYAWCCFFAELVWKESFEKYKPEYVKVLNKLFSGSVVQTFRNFNYMPVDFQVSLKPEIGSLVCWQSLKNPTQGHIGIVVEVLSDGSFKSIEGNTNENGSREGYIVGLKSRKLNVPGMKTLGFISFKN